MKKKLIMLALAGMMGVSTFGGIALTASAANVEDKPFTFDNRNSTGNSEWRDKNDTTKVYVYPTAGPKIFYTVQGMNGQYGTARDRSNVVAIPQGVQGSITNQVREKGDDRARLKYQRITTGYVTTSGVWSPDSTRNYTIFN